MRLLNEWPPWLVAVVIVGITEIYCVGLQLGFRLWLGHNKIKENNEVAGFKFAVVGVLYAVLLAFIVIAVWEEYRDTEGNVRNEAKALVDLSELSYVMQAEAGSEVRDRLATYIKFVHDAEWPAMAHGHPSAATARALSELSQSVFTARPDDQSEAGVYNHAVDLLTIVSDSRSERLYSSEGSIQPALWLVLLAGGLITLGYPAFFAAPSVLAQVLMTGSLAALVGLTLFVCIILDYPFTGEVQISPDPFQQALEQIPPKWPP